LKYTSVKPFISTLTADKFIALVPLILTFKVTQEMEMEELIKKWLPHIRVIEPLSLKEKIEKELREYLLTE